MTADFTIHSGWGDHISWSNPEAFDNGFEGEFRVNGHMRKIPRVGDTLMGEFGRSFVKFMFTEVKRMADPPDQFFGVVIPIMQEMKHGQNER